VLESLRRSSLVKRLPPDDFRATRLILEPEDFAISIGEESPPSDLVDEDTWYGIVTLPDDVSIRTSNHHGQLLKMMYELWGAWIEAVGEPVEPIEEDPLYGTILDAADEFKAATFNSLHGYYRPSVSCLRNALELMTIGTYCQVCDREKEYKRWRAGEIEIGFGHTCDILGQTEPVRSLESHLRNSLNDSIFGQRRDGYPGGSARRLYSRLSDYSHSRPGSTHFDMWNSTGPVYSRNAFIETTQFHFETCLLCFTLTKLGRSDFILPQAAKQLYESERIHPTRIARAAYEYLFESDSTTS